VLVKPDDEFDYNEWIEAMNVINNFRAVHGHPLNTFQTTLRIKGRQIDPDVIVAQRIKRLSSITGKLYRYPKMTLSQMQDIGGCRAVVDSAGSVDRLVQSYIDSDLKHVLHTNDDYISEPKITGYRGRHLIYRYHSDKISTYNGLKIEVQFRSQYQHDWATAVEIVGTFTRQALKSSQGEDSWLRFFALMGSAIALIEGTPTVPGTPANPDDLVSELKDAEYRLDAIRRLRAFSIAPVHVEGLSKDKVHFFLMELDIQNNRLNIEGYTSRDLSLASERYLDAEKRIGSGISSDAVLVSVDSISSLRRAYPNYYLDSDLFVSLIEEAIEGAFYQ
jgi:hypothetical protein